MHSAALSLEKIAIVHIIIFLVPTRSRQYPRQAGAEAMASRTVEISVWYLGLSDVNLLAWESM
jgi:hypothetical protein